MRKYFKHIAATVVVLTGFMVMDLYAPPGGGGGVAGGTAGSGADCWPPPCIPIDGGATLLLAAGAAFGLRKLMH